MKTKNPIKPSKRTKRTERKGTIRKRTRDKIGSNIEDEKQRFEAGINIFRESGIKFDFTTEGTITKLKLSTLIDSLSIPKLEGIGWRYSITGKWIFQRNIRVNRE